MERPQCMPRATWDVIPPEAQAVLAVVIASFEVQIADLKASLKRDSSNPSRPPSSDPPHRRPAPPRKPSGRRRGGQPGRRRNDRIRLAPDEVVDARPDHCRRYGEALAGDARPPGLRGPRRQAARGRSRLRAPRAGRLRGVGGRGPDEQATRRPRDEGALRPADRPGVGLRAGASHGRGPGPDPRRVPRTYPQDPRQRRRDEQAPGTRPRLALDGLDQESGRLPGRVEPRPRRLRGADGPVAAGGRDVGPPLGPLAPAARATPGMSGPPPPRLPGDRRPRRRRLDDRFGPADARRRPVRRLVEGPRRRVVAARVRGRDPAVAASRGSYAAGSGPAMRLEEDGGDLPRGPQDRAVLVDVRDGRGRRPDEQRGRAVAPSGRLLAQDQLRRRSRPGAASSSGC